MNYNPKIPSQVAGKLFSGALWKVGNKKIEIYDSNEDGTVVCGDETGNQITLKASDFVKGVFLKDLYNDCD